MNYLIEKAYNFVLLIIVILVILMLFFFALYMYTAKKKKNRKEEDVYYDNLVRKDAQSFINDIEDIVDGMIVTDHHRRFVAAIKCSGIPLATASSGQVASTLQGYLAFVNTIDRPITYRQYYVPMSLDSTKNMYATRYAELERELFHMSEDRKTVLERLNDVRGIDLLQEEALLERLESLQKEISNMEWRRLHMKDQMDRMEQQFSGALQPSIEEAYLMDWTFNPNDYSVEMDEEEIHKKAIQELNNICNNKIHILAGCNVSAYRCSTEELIEMCYQHTHPLSSAEFKMTDVMNSAFFDEYVSSNDLQRKRDTAYRDAMLSEGVSMMERMKEMTEEVIAEGEAQEETDETEQH